MTGRNLRPENEVSQSDRSVLMQTNCCLLASLRRLGCSRTVPMIGMKVCANTNPENGFV